MDLYMGATYATGEPDIVTNPDAWNSWWSTLTQADKIAWAETYTGRTNLSYADTLGIARNYAQTGGVEVGEHVVSEYTVARIAQQTEEQRRRNVRTMLTIGAVGLGAWFVFGRKRRR